MKVCVLCICVQFQCSWTSNSVCPQVTTFFWYFLCCKILEREVWLFKWLLVFILFLIVVNCAFSEGRGWRILSMSLWWTHTYLMWIHSLLNPGHSRLAAGVVSVWCCWCHLFKNVRLYILATLLYFIFPHAQKVRIQISYPRNGLQLK